MTTQGISQIMARADKITPDVGMKANDTTFESFMSSQAVQASGKADNKAGVSKTVTDRKDLTANRYSKENSVNVNNGSSNQQVKDTSTYESPEDLEVSAEEAAEIAVQTMVVLQEMFGLSMVELQDIMNQLTLEPQDLLFTMNDGTFSPVNIGAIQELLLGIHGIDDAAVLLTNDGLAQELAAVTQQISELLADHFEVNADELASMDPALLDSFAKQLVQFEKGMDEELSAGMPEEDMSLMQASEETMTVVLETQEDAGGKESSAGQSQNGGQQTAHDMPAAQASAVNAFTENLVQAFEEVRGTEEVSPESLMRQIVEQVVRQVRIRVMPETTSMELQLHPASLGRVNLTVATTAGAATASLVVENQMAKEALESQMIQLKESFAEQGLKVDAVEVTVAEFGLKKENQQQDDPSDSRKQNRRSHSEENGSDSDEGSADNVTASDRRDVNSVVDYTA